MRRSIVLALVLLGLSLFDGLATVHHFGEWTGIVEANPVMAPLLRWPALFVLVKLALCGGCAAILVRRGGRVATVALSGAVLLYAGIAVYHMVVLAVPAGGGW